MLMLRAAGHAALVHPTRALDGFVPARLADIAELLDTSCPLATSYIPRTMRRISRLTLIVGVDARRPSRHLLLAAPMLLLLLL